MNPYFRWLLLIALVMAWPLATAAQDEVFDGEDEETEGDEDEVDDEEAEEEEEEDVSASASFGGDTEVPEAADEDEEEEAEESVEPKILQGTWTKQILFSTDDGWFKFQPRGWVQPRFKLGIDPAAGDRDAPNDNALEGSGFSLKRARFGFKAWLFDWARIYLDTGFSSGRGKLVDYFVDLDPWDGALVIRVGHFRPYICRQLLHATTKLQMIEYARAWTDAQLGLGFDRDLGLGLHGMLFDGLEYGLGIWNGEDFDHTFSLRPTEGDEETAAAPGNIDYMMGGRLAAHVLSFAGIGRTLPYGDESDSGISDKPGLVLGVAAFYNKRHHNTIMLDPTTPQLYYDNQFKLGVDLAFQYKGASAEAEFFMLKGWVQDDAPRPVKQAVKAFDEGNAINLEGTGLGTYVQLGYFVLPRDLEIAARFDMVDEDTGIRGTRIYPAIGGTYYFHGNNLKLQLMYRLNTGMGYVKADGDPGYIDTTHDIFLMLQASI